MTDALEVCFETATESMSHTLLASLFTVLRLLRDVVPESVDMHETTFPLVDSLASLCASFDPFLSDAHTTIEAAVENWVPIHVADEPRVTKLRHVLVILDTRMEAAGKVRDYTKESSFKERAIELRDHGNVIYKK